MRYKLILALLILSACDTASQTDYIIDQKGDTTYGKLTYDLFKTPKLSAEGKVIICTPATTKEYYQTKNNKLVNSKTLPGKRKPTFVDVYEKGSIMLYQTQSTTSAGGVPVTNTKWYAQKGENELVEVKTNSVIGGRSRQKEAILQLISDNPELLERFESEKSFSFETIQALIRDYNQQSTAKKM